MMAADLNPLNKCAICICCCDYEHWHSLGIAVAEEETCREALKTNAKKIGREAVALVALVMARYTVGALRFAKEEEVREVVAEVARKDDGAIARGNAVGFIYTTLKPLTVESAGTRRATCFVSSCVVIFALCRRGGTAGGSCWRCRGCEWRAIFYAYFCRCGGPVAVITL
jgi:hypothetical protein